MNGHRANPDLGSRVVLVERRSRGRDGGPDKAATVAAREEHRVDPGPLIKRDEGITPRNEGNEGEKSTLRHNGKSTLLDFVLVIPYSEPTETSFPGPA